MNNPERILLDPSKLPARKYWSLLLKKTLNHIILYPIARVSNSGLQVISDAQKDPV